MPFPTSGSAIFTQDNISRALILKYLATEAVHSATVTRYTVEPGGYVIFQLFMDVSGVQIVDGATLFDEFYTWAQWVDEDLPDAVELGTTLRELSMGSFGAAEDLPNIYVNNPTLNNLLPGIGTLTDFDITWTWGPMGLSNWSGSIYDTHQWSLTQNPLAPNRIYNTIQNLVQQSTYYIRFTNNNVINKLLYLTTGSIVNYQMSASFTVEAVPGRIPMGIPPSTTPEDALIPYGVGFDLGGAFTIQALSDASGIYTLTPGLYRDELWQRTGTTAETESFEIPQPFFKTGYIGDK